MHQEGDRSYWHFILVCWFALGKYINRLRGCKNLRVNRTASSHCIKLNA